MSTFTAGSGVNERFIDILAPWIGTRNLGDLVIRDAVCGALASRGVLANSVTSSQIKPCRHTRAQLEGVGPILVAGTNLLPFRSAKDPQFPVPAVARRQIEGRVVLFGVGWRRYAAQWDKDSAKTTLRLLSKVYPQSVRDSHTQGLLRELGVESVLTGCPTLWSVPEQLGEFDEGSVVLTITDYSPDSGRDRRLLDWAQRRFRNAVLQPLGPRDAEIAIREYKWDPARVLPYSLADFSKYLIDHRPMYMGTRLHAAIRVMQYGLPAAIVAIDNRAKEMGADFGLHITDGQSLRELDDALVRSQERVPAGLREARSQGAHYLNELTARLAANE